MSGLSVAEYVATITSRDQTWRDLALCHGSTVEVQRMFMCTEDQIFETPSGKVSGHAVQTFVVESFCRHCPVQWECARSGLVEEELEGDRTTGAWSMTRRDRRWLYQQSDALGQIDLAKVANEPVTDMVKRLRAERD